MQTQKTITNKAFFLDRDGVINKEKDYVHKIEDFEFIEGVFEACLKINDAGYKIIIVTNQSGIGRGYYTEEDFNLLNQWMIRQFERKGVLITDVYFCPHHAEQGKGKYRTHCNNRKPEPGMILEAQLKYDIDLEQSVLIGDRLSDIRAAEKAGVGECYLITEDENLSQNMEIATANGLLGAVIKHLLP